MLYNDFIKTLSDRFIGRLDSISIDYNFDYGDEFEVAICDILRSFLPQKYGICRGCVVDSKGNKAGDDIIIYDQESFPTLRSNSRHDFARKDNIPIEAVYAYIEAKHKLDKQTICVAIEQVIKVKQLCDTRKHRSLDCLDLLKEDNHPRRQLVSCYPDHRNPVLCMIISRYSVDKNDKKSSEALEINGFLGEEIKKMNHSDYMPDLIIAGKSNGLFIGYRENDIDIPTIFTVPKVNGRIIGYQNLIKPDIAYGVALAHLMAALDFIKLGQMPWIDILNDAK